MIDNVIIDKFKKQNALIHASTNNKITYKEAHHDLLNLLMGLIQKLYLKGKNFNSISITKEQLCKGANLHIANSVFPYLKDLAHITYNFTDDDIKKINKNNPNDKIIKGFFSFIVGVKEVESKQDKKQKVYKIKFNPDLFSLLLDNKYSVDNGNYTTVKIADISLLKSKYEKILGEIILSKKFKKEFSLDYEFLRKRFNITDRPFGYLTKILNRQLPKLQGSFMDFNYEMHKKDKKISFVLK